MKNACLSGPIPLKIGTLRNLTVLELTDYSTSSASSCPVIDFGKTPLPSSIGDATQLTKLVVSIRTLGGTIPPQIGSLTSLEELSLGSKAGGRTTAIRGPIPSAIWKLKALKTLRLEGTELTFFDDPEGDTLHDLETFSLSGSRLFYGDVSHLVNSSRKLTTLDFSNSRVTIQPSLFQKLHNLTYLNLMNVERLFWDIPDEFWASLPNLRYFSIAGAYSIIGSIGESIRYMPHLRYLNVSGSALTSTIPPEIGLCPLETLSVTKAMIMSPIPHEIGYLNRTLVHLEISDLRVSGSTIPAAIGALRRLKTLTLRSNGFIGTIPSSFALLTNLEEVRLDNNGLTGPLPAFGGYTPLLIDVHHNRLSGTIPRSIASRVWSFELSYNQFGPEIDSTLFLDNGIIQQIFMSHNSFIGPLPLLQLQKSRTKVDFSYNAFQGEVPATYCEAMDLQLSHNKLYGSLDPFLSLPCPRLRSLYIDDNDFQGTFPDVNHQLMLTTLSLRNNHFNGDLPAISPRLSYFDASGNALRAANLGEWSLSSSYRSLNYLDLSYNAIVLPNEFKSDIFGTKLTFLSLAFNDLRGARTIFPISARYALTGLDLSKYVFAPSALQVHISVSIDSNIPPYFASSITVLLNVELEIASGSHMKSTFLGGRFPTELFPNLALLKLAHNDFSGELQLTQMQSITQLDISYNRFMFEATRFSSMPLLTTLNAADNQIYGSLLLESMPNLQSANFAMNDLDQKPDFAAIGTLFRGPLRSLDITRCDRLSPMTSFDTATTGLARTATSAPSHGFPNSVTCYELAFYNQTGRNFAYDEDIFSYLQCDCNRGHFGFPPVTCYTCPSAGVTSCGGDKMVVPANNFIFVFDPSNSSSPGDILTPSETLQSASDLVTAMWTSFAAIISSERSSDDPMGSYISSLHIKFEAESCLATTIQILRGRSNCKGVEISARELRNDYKPAATLVESQCKQGSEGRLCSRCTCSGTNCWYQNGATCSKCHHVFRLSTSLPVAAALLVLLLIGMIVIMTIILRKRRTQSIMRIEHLSPAKRVLYRLIYLTTLGNVPILITFLQIVIAFTQWDSYAHLGFLSVINGESGGIGLRCLFPFLSQPLLALLAQLSLPFVIIVMLALSIGIGGYMANFLERRQQHRIRRGRGGLNRDDPLSLLHSNQEIDVEYPTSALLVSLSITVIKFFYFGTAMAAHENLFLVRQPLSGVKYLQNTPWMKSTEAAGLIMASVPAIVLIDLIIPLFFIIICWKVRDSSKLHQVRVYYGPLYETYSAPCFWWEIVNTFKKLFIAIILKAVPASDALQSALIISILSSVLLIQLTISPWKRKIENFFDSASSLLLIGALISTRTAHISHIPGVAWYMFALSVGFVFGSVVVVIWQSSTGTTEYEKRVREFEVGNVLGGQMHTVNGESHTDLWGLLGELDNGTAMN